MHRNDRWPEDYDPDGTASRSSSRRSSLTRRSSVKNEKEVKKDKEVKKKSPLNASSSSATSTPKRVAKPQNLEFLVTGKQCLKKCDRANSLPGYHRRPSSEGRAKKFEAPKRAPAPAASQSSKSRETSLEDDVSLDLSQVSDFEDTNSKYGFKNKLTALATSTPKGKPKARSASLRSDLMKSKSNASATASNYTRYSVNTDLDYSSVSPDYSGQSSTELSPRVPVELTTPRSQDPHASSCCGSSWQDCSELDHTMHRNDGEWSEFWANYNNSIAKVPMKNYYDQCPTPYRTDNIDLADLEFSTEGGKRSPDHMEHLNSIIRNEGLRLTPRETQNVIKCAHILGGVLSKALERTCKERDGERVQEVVQEGKVEEGGEVEPEPEEETLQEDPELEIRKRTMVLDLKDTTEPAVVVKEKKNENVQTQTDISLPNTKSAPRIFEKILKQLSRSSLDEGLKVMAENKEKEEKSLVKKEN